MDPPKEPSSLGGRKARDPRKLNSNVTPLDLVSISDDLVIGSLMLDKPSGLHGAPKQKKVVFFEVADRFALRILREIHHPNVLHLESSIKKSKRDSEYLVCVEPYTSSLYRFAASLNIKFDGHEDHLKLKKIIRQMIEGVNELILNGLYHGNIDIHTTYYDKGTMNVKLANFKERVCCKDITEAQYEDWHEVGNAIVDLSSLMKQASVVDLSAMDDLANYLNCLANKCFPLKLVKENALRHVFFWNEIRRTTFFIHDLTAVLYYDTFKSMVEELEGCIPNNWNQNDHGGLLSVMNKYRTDRKKSVYGGSKYEYVLFVSGSYTHQNEFPIALDVDAIVTGVSPRLCLELVNIVRKLGCNV